MSLLLRVVLAGGLACAAYWSARLAWAEWELQRNTPESLRNAMRLAPGDSRPRFAAGDLEGALERNPRHARAWIEFALKAEHAGRADLAEQRFLKAAGCDRGFEPRWSLANFYFRAGNWPAFWNWSRQALAVRRSDPTAVFHLGLHAEPDPVRLMERLVPPDRLGEYFAFLLSRKVGGEALPVALQVAATASAGDVSRLLDYCDLLLARGSAAPALQLWNHVHDRGLLSFSKLDPAAGRSLTDGGFARPPLGKAFGWRTAAGSEIEAYWRPGGMRLAFTGRAPESLELLSQYVPLQPGRSYRLTAAWAPGEIEPGAVTRWALLDAASGAPLGSGNHFQSPPGAGLGRLVLAYHRQPGATPPSGTLELRHVRLELQSP